MANYDFLQTDWNLLKWNLFENKEQEEIWFKHNPPIDQFPPYYFLKADDWYMIVAIEKGNKVKKQRELLTAYLFYSYAFAIEKAFSNNLDSNLRQKWDLPSNTDTIYGIKKYINKIELNQK